VGRAEDFSPFSPRIAEIAVADAAGVAVGDFTFVEVAAVAAVGNSGELVGVADFADFADFRALADRNVCSTGVADLAGF
jgi:hypothetical protein